MINEENLNNLYEGITNSNELTTKELNNYGFNSKDLANLIEQGVLKRIKRGYYSFQSIDELFIYGKKLLEAKEFDKSEKCFKKCYELDPNNQYVCFQLFLSSVNKKDYESAFKYFESLEKIESNNDYNLYLYLLSIVTDIPNKYKERVRNFELNDVSIDTKDERYKDIPQHNQIRSLILQKKFPYALKQLNNLISQQNSFTIQNIIIKNLLFQAVKVETVSKDNLLILSQNKKHKEIINYLEKKQKRNNLSLTDSYILKLAKIIIKLQETKQIPNKTISESEDLFDAIDGNNFTLALSLNESYLKKYHMNNSNNVIYLLLTNICDIIKNIDLANQTSANATKKEVSNEITEHKDQPTTSSNILFSDIVRLLMNNDLENAFKALKNYMILINKKEYEFLIVNLIKLSLIEKDIAFAKPAITLAYISSDNFKFDISSYIQEFYIALVQNKFDEAKIYLDIISNSNKLGQSNISIEELANVLNNIKTMVNYKGNNLILDIIGNEFEKKNITNIKQPNNEETPIASSKIEKELEVKTSTIKKEISNERTKTIDKEKSFIEKKHELLLKNQGIIILKNMSDERQEIINNIVKEYPDMVSFSIGEGKKKQIVLKYKQPLDENVDISDLINKGSLAYMEGNYKDCLKNYLQILKIEEPKAFIFARIGLAYMKSWKIDLAIQYLTIATYLSKQEDGHFDFTDLLIKLNNLVPKEDFKPSFKMDLNDFDNDIQNHYGIENFDEITSYILENGLDVKTACQDLGMTDEQIDAIRLIYAKQFYSQGYYKKGDQFVKTVEKNKNKTKTTLKLIKEIKKNKKFYINRPNENSQQLTLTLQPQKINKI